MGHSRPVTALLYCPKLHLVGSLYIIGRLLVYFRFIDLQRAGWEDNVSGCSVHLP